MVGVKRKHFSKSVNISFRTLDLVVEADWEIKGRGRWVSRTLCRL